MCMMVFLQFILCMYIHTVSAFSISVYFQKFHDGSGGSGSSSCCGVACVHSINHSVV